MDLFFIFSSYFLLEKILIFDINGLYRQRSHQEELPVSWHQSLLSFVEKYAKDISTEQREALLDLIKVSFYHTVSL
jgi:essential nuclear protein 1